MRQTFDDVVVLSTLYVNQGFIEGRIKDGTSCRILRLESGRWQAYLRAEAVGSPMATWELASQHLAHLLLAERKALRFGG